MAWLVRMAEVGVDAVTKMWGAVAAVDKVSFCLLYTSLAKTRADQFATVSPPFGQPTYFGWVARKGDVDTLIAAVDAALDKIAKDGRMKKIQEKWFGVAAVLPAKMPEL